MRIVIALGGNALLKRGQPATAEVQRANVTRACRLLADVARGNELVLTHGNGPQVGLLALQAEAYDAVRPYPLDILGAESEGMLGYLIEQELSNELPDREVAALLTRVEVDPRDPAFDIPTKPIGPVYPDEQEALRVAAQRGWSIAQDGPGFRRVVASPRPIRVIELNTIALLLNAGHIVVCAGGGGIPVVRANDDSIHGIEAVVDKDSTSCLLATQLDADQLILLTDVAGVYRRWPADPEETPINTICPELLRTYSFDPGSMAPKVEAACRFAAQSGKTAAIGSLHEAPAIVHGDRGTQIRQDESAHSDAQDSKAQET